MALSALFFSTRPRHWTKNLVVFAGLGFSGTAFHATSLGRASLLFLFFILASSSVYLFNDVLDRERDRHHPQKRYRPIASGRLAVSTALQFAALFAVLAVAGAFVLCLQVGLAVLAYLVLQFAYSTRLKHVVILDIFCIGAGFMIRVLAGVLVVNVALSPWLVACSVQLALFLALCKRRAEAVKLNDGDSMSRPTLEDYAGPGLDVMISIMASSTLVTYTLYTLLPANLLSSGALQQSSKAGSPGMVWTVPVVFYGVLRYLYLVYQRQRGERPEKLVTSDRPLFFAALLYITITSLVLYSPWTQN